MLMVWLSGTILDRSCVNAWERIQSDPKVDQSQLYLVPCKWGFNGFQQTRQCHGLYALELMGLNTISNMIFLRRYSIQNLIMDDTFALFSSELHCSGKKYCMCGLSFKLCHIFTLYAEIKTSFKTSTGQIVVQGFMKIKHLGELKHFIGQRVCRNNKML